MSTQKTSSLDVNILDREFRVSLGELAEALGNGSRGQGVVGIGRLRGLGGFAGDSAGYVEHRALRQRAQELARRRAAAGSRQGNGRLIDPWQGSSFAINPRD